MANRDLELKNRTIHWSITGFLIVALALATGSQTFAQGSASDGQSKAAACAACHGIDGNSVTPEWPSLAGQHPNYTRRQLRSYQSGDREDVLMSAFASTLSAEDIDDLAAYFATLPAAQRGTDPELLELGQRIYRGGIPDRGVAACIACHGPAGRGNPLASYPVVRGQHATYIVNTLAAYAAGTRRSDAASNLMMQDIAVSLRDDEIRAVASYMQGLR